MCSQAAFWFSSHWEWPVRSARYNPGAINKFEGQMPALHWCADTFSPAPSASLVLSDADMMSGCKCLDGFKVPYTMSWMQITRQ